MASINAPTPLYTRPDRLPRHMTYKMSDPSVMQAFLPIVPIPVAAQRLIAFIQRWSETSREEVESESIVADEAVGYRSAPSGNS